MGCVKGGIFGVAEPQDEQQDELRLRFNSSNSKLIPRISPVVEFFQKENTVYQMLFRHVR